MKRSQALSSDNLTTEALTEARSAIYRLCLERGSTDGYSAVFEKINAALAADRGAVDRIAELEAELATLKRTDKARAIHQRQRMVRGPEPDAAGGQ